MTFNDDLVLDVVVYQQPAADDSLVDALNGPNLVDLPQTQPRQWLGRGDPEIAVRLWSTVFVDGVWRVLALIAEPPSPLVSGKKASQVAFVWAARKEISDVESSFY
jgi:hypothetical protein